MTDTKIKPVSPSEVKEESDSAETADAPVIDAVDGAAEFVDKLPSEAGENAPEQQSDSADGGGQASDDQGDDATPVSDLQEIQYPSRRVMKTQVQTALIKEESKLIKEASEHGRKGEFFELNNVLAKIREIRFMLSELVKETFDGIKNLWLKYVYNKK